MSSWLAIWMQSLEVLPVVLSLGGTQQRAKGLGRCNSEKEGYLACQQSPRSCFSSAIAKNNPYKSPEFSPKPDRCTIMSSVSDVVLFRFKRDGNNGLRC